MKAAMIIFAALTMQGHTVEQWNWGVPAGISRVYRVIDHETGVVCYVATTDSRPAVPSMQCLKATLPK